ncbi:MAG: hypothetical protein ABEH43_11125, partial [Flavobacteriales bacterium]
KDWEIEEVEKVKTNKGTMYELEVEDEDETYMEVYFNKKGEIAYEHEEEHEHHEEGEEHEHHEEDQH